METLITEALPAGPPEELELALEIRKHEHVGRKIMFRWEGAGCRRT